MFGIGLMADHNHQIAFFRIQHPAPLVSVKIGFQVKLRVEARP